MFEEALELALEAHKGKIDKAGMPYILHPLRVATQFTEDFLQTVGVLHDVVEDSEITVKDLYHRFGIGVAGAVDILTRKQGELYTDYIDRIQAESALQIKLADLHDNLLPWRVATITDTHKKRYEDALTIIQQRLTLYRTVR